MASGRTPFRLGKKELFIPDITLKLLRTPALPANYAKFHVPLWFSKLDLRDYLYHVYGVTIFSTRSYVKQQRVVAGSPGIERPQPSRWHRPRAQKTMIVELQSPFVWPDEPEDLKEWNFKENRMAAKEEETWQRSNGPLGDTVINEERRKSMREQAQALLEGKETWRTGSSESSRMMLNR